MTKREYAEAIASGVNGEVTEVSKANNVVMTGIQRAKEGSNIMPVIYIDDLYDEDYPIDEATEMVGRKLNEHAIDSVDIDFISDYDQIKDKLRARLYYNATPAEIARSAQEYGFDDLIIVPYIDGIVQIGEGKGSVKVTTSLIEKWGKTPDEVIDVAIQNSKSDVSVVNMMQMMKEMGVDMGSIPDDSKMIIITNKDRMFGAISVLFALDEIKETFPEGFAILPSSVHEVIAVPASAGDVGTYNDMVAEVNDTQVLPQERLGVHAYYMAA